MEKMIKRGLMLTLLLVNTLFVNAQALWFDCHELKTGVKAWECGTDIWDPDPITIIVQANILNDVILILSPDINVMTDRFTLVQVDIYLSNGEILTCWQSGNTTLPEKQNIYIKQLSRDITSNRHKDKNGIGPYIMTQLRKYNITKIVCKDQIINTPNFRSAATIDAMCKKLIQYTGDQGQYGGMTANNSTSKNNNSTSSRTNPTTRQNSTSTQTRPNTNSNSVNSNISEAKRLYAQKEMDVVRMAKYPLGFLSPSTRTRAEVKKQTDACGVSYDVSRETNTFFDSDGYNLKWHGKNPLSVCLNMGGTHWDEWHYTFIYDTNEEGLMRAKEIESTLRSQMGLNWTSPKGNSSKFYYRECEQNGMKYEIDYIVYNSTSYHLRFYIYRLKDDSSTTKSTTTTTNSNNGIKAWFDKIWVDHNVYENGRKGMRIHSHFFVHYAKSLQMSVNYYFYYNDNRVLRDTNNSYCTVDGQACCFSGIKPGYDQTEYSDLSVFMPYDELDLSRGNYNLKFRGEIHYGGKSYCISDWVYFDFNK